MVILCWAAKGGSGTTVVAAALALTSARPALLVDLDGELPAVARHPRTRSTGRLDWLASDAPAAHLADLTDRDRTAGRPVAVRRSSRTPTAAGVADNARIATSDGWSSPVGWPNGSSPGVDVIDRRRHRRTAPRARRRGRPPPARDQTVLPALDARAAAPTRPSGVIVVDEPGHALCSATSSARSGHRSWPRSASIRRSPVPSMPAC